MFKSIKRLIDSRMGKNVVLADFTSNHGYFIKIQAEALYDVAFFLKHDPDVKLTLFDQILFIPSQYLPWPNTAEKLEILYQLRSLKLPYKVTLVLDIADDQISIPSIRSLYAGAAKEEQKIATLYGLSLEERE